MPGNQVIRNTAPTHPFDDYGPQIEDEIAPPLFERGRHQGKLIAVVVGTSITGVLALAAQNLAQSFGCAEQVEPYTKPVINVCLVSSLVSLWALSMGDIFSAIVH